MISLTVFSSGIICKRHQANFVTLLDKITGVGTMVKHDSACSLLSEFSKTYHSK